MRSKKNYIVGKWYFIDYINKRSPERSFTGPAELMKITDDGYWFYSPFSDHKNGLVQCCDCLAFRAFDDGKIGAGVGAEILEASRLNLPIIQLPNSNYPILSIEQTRERRRNSLKR